MSTAREQSLRREAERRGLWMRRSRQAHRCWAILNPVFVDDYMAEYVYSLDEVEAYLTAGPGSTLAQIRTAARVARDIEDANNAAVRGDDE
jgi:hypothetical protein